MIENVPGAAGGWLEAKERLDQPTPSPQHTESMDQLRHDPMGGSACAPVAQPMPPRPPRCQASSLAAELRARWEAGGRPSALDLLEEFDQQVLSRDDLLDLVYEQILQRYAAGLDPDLEPLCGRFPELANSFHRMASLHHAMHAARPQSPQPGTWPLPGDAWKHYYLIEELGSGGFARVYLAADMTLGWRLVVLKLSGSLAVEAEALARLNHPNIVPVLSAIPAEPPEPAALCMPYMGRATLQAVMDHLGVRDSLPRRARSVLQAIEAINRDEQEQEQLDAALPPSSDHSDHAQRTWFGPCSVQPDPRLSVACYVDGVVHLGAQLASALAAAHAANICHFDIKPSNILMAPGGVPMLLDFNLASNQGRARGGTPRYMAPEQLQAVLAGEKTCPLGPAADVYSLGVVLYELLAGRHPRADHPQDGGTRLAPEALAAYHSRALVPIGRWNRQVDARVAQLVHQALALDPAQRPTATQLAAGLRAALSPPARSARWLQQHRLLAAVSTVCLVLLAAAAGVAWRRLPNPTERARAHALACLKNDDPQAAVAALQECLEHDHRDAVTWFLLGRAHERLENWHQALQAYKEARACAAHPWLDACIGTAILRDNGPPATALLHLRDAYRDGLETPGLYNNLGLACRKRFLLEQAQTWLNLAVDRQPDLQAARLNRAVLAFCMALRDKAVLPPTAVDDIEAAIALGPPSVELYARAASIHLAAQAEGAPPSPIAVERLTQALRHSQQPRLPYWSLQLAALMPTLPAELVGSDEPWPAFAQPVADPLAHLSVQEQARLLAQRLAKR